MDAKTPKMQEPQADYAADTKQLSTTTTTATATVATAANGSRPHRVVAQVARVDEDGQQFDENGIRIGRWEMSPCGDHCVPNVLVAFFLPCVSIAQISHRMGGSYMTMLVFSGVLYIACNLAWTQSFEESELVIFSDGIHRETIEERMPWTPRRAVCTAMSGIMGLIWVMMMLTLRSGVRDRFQIPGSCCGDYCCVIWCGWCALTQMATHIKSYRPGSCDLVAAVDQLPAYDVDSAVGERV